MSKKNDIENHINFLANENGGKITADIVVADAKNPDSPLHDEFDWDVNSAAAKHWIDTARNLIRSVRIKITIEKTEVRSVAYIRDPEVNAGDQGYASILHIRTDEDVARDALIYEFGKAGAVLKRAQEIDNVLDIPDEVNLVTVELDALAVSVQNLQTQMEQHYLV